MAAARAHPQALDFLLLSGASNAAPSSSSSRTPSGGDEAHRLQRTSADDAVARKSGSHFGDRVKDACGRCSEIDSEGGDAGDMDVLEKELRQSAAAVLRSSQPLSQPIKEATDMDAARQLGLF